MIRGVDLDCVLRSNEAAQGLGATMPRIFFPISTPRNNALFKKTSQTSAATSYALDSTEEQQEPPPRDKHEQRPANYNSDSSCTTDGDSGRSSLDLLNPASTRPRNRDAAACGGRGQVSLQQQQRTATRAHDAKDGADLRADRSPTAKRIRRTGQEGPAKVA